MTPLEPHRMRRPLLRLAALATALLPLLAVQQVFAADYVPVSGAGSTWSQNALDQWRRNVNQYGLTVNYQGSGSSDGRNQYRNGTVDFAVSEIPYGLKDGGVVDDPPKRKYAYMPIVAGGTSFMYNLTIGGKRVTNLRLSGANLAKLFTGVITQWNDPALQADNPALALPARRVVPVVRSDGSGTTAQFTSWMAKDHAQLWDAYCAKAGRQTPCGTTSNYPVVQGRGFTAQSGSLGVAGYTAQAQSNGAITYVEYSYAVNSGFPVAKLLNRAGYYTAPTASNVAVALLKNRINTDESSPAYLTSILDEVYRNPDPRTYPVSSYSYMVVPTAVEGNFSNAKGKSLGAFAYYFLCEGQQQAPVLGYSPLPINLVQAGLDQVRRIPGVDVQSVDIKKCNNPTFSSDGTNTLAAKAPQPAACDRQGPTQCGEGTGGAATTPTVSSRGTTGNVTGPTTPGAAATSGDGSTPGSAAVTSGTAGAAPDGAAPAGTPGDADLGTQVAASQTLAAAAVPLSLAAPTGGGLRHLLMVLALALVVAVAVVPPLVGRRLAAAGQVR